MKRVLVLAVASCVNTAPAFPVIVPSTPGVATIGSFHLGASDDNVQNTCAPSGARDVSFQLTTQTVQTVLFDTDPDPTKTNAAVAMSLFDGPCPAQQAMQCSIDSCPGSTYGSLAATLAGQHTYCLVVEQAHPSSSTDLVTLRMFASGRAAAMIFDASSAMMAGTTCAGDDTAAPAFDCATGGGAPSSAALVPVCPGSHHLMGSVSPDQPIAFSLRAQSPGALQVRCFVAGAPGPVDLPDTLMGPQPYWLLIERATSSCGAFQLRLAAP